MIEFLSRRLAAALVTLVLATVVVFAVVEILPGDPALVMLGPDAPASAVAALRAKLGLDHPPIVRYLAWVSDLIRFRLGTSYTYGSAVGELIGERL
ncbi:MAG: hypothetical protein JO161_03805, partial [Planctomycetaceae bacterium]|nr:hypothetical protein [Planctomycetaceae bacterium]